MSERSRLAYYNFVPQLESMTETERLETYAQLDGQARSLGQRLSYVKYTMALRGELEDVRLKAAMIERRWLSEVMNRTVELEPCYATGAPGSSNTLH